MFCGKMLSWSTEYLEVSDESGIGLALCQHSGGDTDDEVTLPESHSGRWVPSGHHQPIELRYKSSSRPLACEVAKCQFTGHMEMTDDQLTNAEEQKHISLETSVLGQAESLRSHEKESELALEKRKRWEVESALKGEKKKVGLAEKRCSVLEEQNKQLQEQLKQERRTLQQMRQLLEKEQLQEQQLLAETDSDRHMDRASEFRLELKRMQAEMHEIKHQHDQLMRQRSRSQQDFKDYSQSVNRDCKTRSLDRWQTGGKRTCRKWESPTNTLTDPHWEELMRPKFPYIVQALRPGKLLNKLFAEHVIDHEDYCKMKQASKTSTNKELSEMLLMEILFTKKPGSFGKFCSVLKCVEGQDHIADVLEPDFDYDIVFVENDAA